MTDIVEARRSVRRRARQTRTSDRDGFQLAGGLNLVDPPSTIRPGYCIAAENYEMGINGGYERLGGFERFDGQAAPSSAAYHIIPFRHGFTLDPLFKTVGQGIYSVNGVALVGYLIESVELSDPACNISHRSELPIISPAAATTAITGDVPPPKQRLFDVQPEGFRLTTSTTLVVTYDSKDTAPKTVLKFLEADDVNNTHKAYFGLGYPTIYTPAGGDKILVAFFARYAGRQYVKVGMGETGGTPLESTQLGGESLDVVLDVLNGTIQANNSGAADAYVEDVDYGDGWYRFVIETKVLDGDFSDSCNVILTLMEDETTATYDGDSTKGIYVAGFWHDAAVSPLLAPYRSRDHNVPPRDSTNENSHHLYSGIGYFAIRGKTANAVYPGSIFANAGQLTAVGSDGPFVHGSGNPKQGHAPTLAKHLEYLDAAAAAARALIAAVPGGGSIRGVWFYHGVVYAFRDDDPDTPTVSKMYKSTSSGWVEVTFALHVDFDAGTTEINEGDTITAFGAGGSATVSRVCLINTDWAGGNAAGTLVLTSVTGNFTTNNDDLRVGGGSVATQDGVSYTPTWNDGGTFRFRTYNFYGASDLRRMYGVNGLDKAFSYDDADGVLHQIRTGMATDTPTHLGVHLYHLFLGFPGGSVQNSGVGRPLNWTVITGASENAVGDDITDFIEEVDDTMFVFTRNQSYRLTGYTVDTFRLQRFDARNGAIENSVQRIGMGIHLDDRGFASLATSDRFGNYQSNTFSRLIQPLVKRLLEETTVTASVIYRGGNRYRCFFSDGRFISIGVNGSNITGHMPCSYGKVVRCICSEEDTDGTERIFFGSDDGYIYEAEKGRSFDGAPVRYGLRPAYHTSGRPDRNKKYYSARIEAILNGQATVKVRPDMSFGKYPLAERDISASLGGAIWDHTMEWEGFYWDQAVEPLKPFRIDADGTNVGLSIYGESSLELPHTLRAVIFQTALRSLKRETSVG